MPAPATQERAKALDEADPLSAVAERVALPDGVVYLAGNSLGPPAADVSRRVAEAIATWGSRLASAWGDGPWMDGPTRIGDRIAPLIGAGRGEVLVADTTSVLLTKVVGAALGARPDRRTIVSSSDNFPSDLYVAANAARGAGAALRMAEPCEVIDALDESVAVCCLTQVDYRTGRLHDVKAITDAAHAAGALMVWDLCHSAGAVPVGCEDHGIDLAVGCTYKYLNGGPGAPAFCYVRRALQGELENPLPGWLGHAAPFAFDLAWDPAPGLRRFLTSTPPVLAMAALDAALDGFDGVAIEELRAKSLALTALFIEVLIDAGFDEADVVTPREDACRGSQVSLRHPRAQEVVASLTAQGIVGDHRPPDLCRFGFAPLYLRFEQVAEAAERVAATAAAFAAPTR